MTRRDLKRGITRRDLIKRFGFLAFVLTPVARAMGYIAGGTFVGAPRFVMFFKGGSFHPASTNPHIDHRPRRHADRAAAPHAQDIILFKNMSIHGGSPKTDGYQEEHAAGLIGCVTGNSYHYSKNDSYYAYTDYESIDITIANHYKTDPGAGGAAVRQPAHRRRARTPTPTTSGSASATSRTASARPADALYGNAIEPVQDAGQVYDSMMQRVNVICARHVEPACHATPASSRRRWSARRA